MELKGCIKPRWIDQLKELADVGRIRQLKNSEWRLPHLHFGASDLDALIRSDKNSVADFRFMKRGVSIDPEALRLIDSEGRLSGEKVNMLKAQHVTIIASRLESKIPAFRSLADEIENKAKSYVRVVGIASFGSVYGMPRHFDHVDVYVLQTDGEKRWHFFGDPIKGAGVNRKLDIEPDLKTRSVDLSGGDQLFVPAGVFHQCDPAEFSCHLAINLKWPCALDLLGIQYDPEKTYDTAMLEPIRSFGEPARIRDIADRFSPILKEHAYSGDIEADLLGWPDRCKRRYPAS